MDKAEIIKMFDKPRKSKAKSGAEVEASYDRKADRITIVIDNVSESFIPSESGKSVKIPYDEQLTTRMKANGNIILVTD